MTPESATLAPGRSQVTASFDPSATTSPRHDQTNWTKARATVIGLLDLNPDWDGYGARPIDRIAVQVADRLLDEFRHGGLPEPAIFPVPDGGVQIEWMSGPVELELEIHPGGTKVVFVCDDPHIRGGIDGELPENRDLLALALRRLAAYS